MGSVGAAIGESTGESVLDAARLRLVSSIADEPAGDRARRAVDRASMGLAGLFDVDFGQFHSPQGRQIVKALECHCVRGGDAFADGIAGQQFCRLHSAVFFNQWGGFGQAPKFPNPAGLDLFLRTHRATGDERYLAMALHTLRRMAAGEPERT